MERNEKILVNCKDTWNLINIKTVPHARTCLEARISLCCPESTSFNPMESGKSRTRNRRWRQWSSFSVRSSRLRARSRQIPNNQTLNKAVRNTRGEPVRRKSRILVHNRVASPQRTTTLNEELNEKSIQAKALYDLTTNEVSLFDTCRSTYSALTRRIEPKLTTQCLLMRQ